MSIVASTLDPRNPEDKETILSAWNALIKIQKRQTLQIHADWFFDNMDWFSPVDRNLRFVLLCKENVPVALVPSESREQKFGPFNILVHGFIDHQAAVPNCACLIDSRTPGVCQALARHLVSRLKPWQAISLEGLSNECSIMENMMNDITEIGHSLGRDFRVQYLISLEGTSEDYMAQRGRNYRKNVRSAERKLERLGRIEYVGPDRLNDSAMNVLRSVDEKSWQMQASEDAEKNRGLLEYIGRLFNNCREEYHHVFRFLLLDSIPIAGHYGFRYRDTFYGIKNVFDEGYNDYSAGTLLLNKVILECFDSEANVLELLARNKYLTSIATGHRNIVRELVFKNGFGGWLMCRVIGAIRRLRQKVKSPED